jgi:hypothetical protein
MMTNEMAIRTRCSSLFVRSATLRAAPHASLPYISTCVASIHVGIV